MLELEKKKSPVHEILLIFSIRSLDVKSLVEKARVF